VLYWDYTNDDMYANTDGSTTWQIIGGASSAAAHNLLSTTHLDATAASVARGSLIIAHDASPTWQRVDHPGGINWYLRSNAADPDWTEDLTLGNGHYVGISGSDLRVQFDTTNGDLELHLGDAAGSDTVAVFDSGGTVRADIDSDGNAWFDGNVDIDGDDLILDADGDSILHTTADDSVEMSIPATGSFDTAIGAASEMRVETGIIEITEYIRHAGDADTSMRFQLDNLTLRAGGVDFLDLVEDATDYISVGAQFRLEGNRIAFDADDDTYAYASGDDEVTLVIAGNAQYKFDATQITISDTGESARLYINTSGNVDSGAPDLQADQSFGTGATRNIGMFIDSNNNDTDRRFAVLHDGDDFQNATELFNVPETGIVNCTFGGVRTIHSEDNVSAPPTDAQLDSAFGEPATVGEGFIGLIDDNNAATTAWLCVSLGGSWWTEGLTKAT